MKKIIYIVVIVLLMVISLSPIVLAGDIPTDQLKQIYQGNSSSLNTMAGKILGVIQVVGITVAIIALSIIGIKYMTASPSGKADYKKTLIGYFIGAILLFAASGILGIIKTFVDRSINT